MKKLIKGVVVWLMRLFGKRNAIIFESVPDFSDNTYAVYQEMLRRGLDKKYKLIWSCGADATLDGAPAQVGYIFPGNKSIKQKLRKIYYMANAKCMICCNRYLLPMRKNQPSFYLSHSTTLKRIRHYYNVPRQIEYCLAAGPGTVDLMAYELNTDREKMFCAGFPRNDVLTQSPEPVKQMLQTDCKKVLVWYPTFRQHKNGRTSGSDKALPIIHDEQAAQKLNQHAAKMDVLLVLKPHFAQDVSYVRDLKLSNIRFIDDSFFKEHNTTSYGFVGGCDGLVTDYSSICFDYLLCDKPMCFVWEDLESYKQEPGVAASFEDCAAMGQPVYTLQDFMDFISNVAQDIDTCKENRNALCHKYNYSRDGKNAARVVDFIIEKSKL